MYHVCSCKCMTLFVDVRLTGYPFITEWIHRVHWNSTWCYFYLHCIKICQYEMCFLGLHKWDRWNNVVGIKLVQYDLVHFVIDWNCILLKAEAFLLLHISIAMWKELSLQWVGKEFFFQYQSKGKVKVFIWWASFPGNRCTKLSQVNPYCIVPFKKNMLDVMFIFYV